MQWYFEVRPTLSDFWKINDNAMQPQGCEYHTWYCLNGGRNTCLLHFNQIKWKSKDSHIEGIYNYCYGVGGKRADGSPDGKQ